MTKKLSGQFEYSLLILPCIAFYIIFHYIPMYGAVIAFKDFRLGDTITSAPWVGLKWFAEFFSSMYFGRLLKNTLLINVYQLVFGFPIPIIFALVLNEIRLKRFKRVVQTVSYMPYFISTVVVVGMLYNFFGVSHGIVNNCLFLWAMRESIISWIVDILDPYTSARVSGKALVMDLSYILLRCPV